MGGGIGGGGGVLVPVLSSAFLRLPSYCHMIVDFPLVCTALRLGLTLLTLCRVCMRTDENLVRIASVVTSRMAVVLEGGEV